MWGRRAVFIGFLAVLSVACTGGENGLTPVPTLPPPDLPDVEFTAAPSMPDDVAEPPVIDEDSFDVFARLDIAGFTLSAAVVASEGQQTFDVRYQSEPDGGVARAVNEISGVENAVDVVWLDDQAWVKFGPTPGGRFVSPEVLDVAELTEIFGYERLVLDAFAESGVRLEDFSLATDVLADPLEFTTADGTYSLFMRDEVVIGGSGDLADADGGTYSFSFSIDVTTEVAPVVGPEDPLTEAEYEAFLAETDPFELQQQLIFTSGYFIELADDPAGLENITVASLTAINDSIPYQTGIDDLNPGVIGVVVSGEEALAVGRMQDGRFFCVAYSGDEPLFGAAYELADIDTAAECSFPAFPDLPPSE